MSANHQIKTAIDTLVRDFCKVYSMPKSEARRRLWEFVELIDNTHAKRHKNTNTQLAGLEQDNSSRPVRADEPNPRDIGQVG